MDTGSEWVNNNNSNNNNNSEFVPNKIYSEIFILNEIQDFWSRIFNFDVSLLQ